MMYIFVCLFVFPTRREGVIFAYVVIREASSGEIQCSEKLMLDTTVTVQGVRIHIMPFCVISARR